MQKMKRMNWIFEWLEGCLFFTCHDGVVDYFQAKKIYAKNDITRQMQLNSMLGFEPSYSLFVYINLISILQLLKQFSIAIKLHGSW